MVKKLISCILLLKHNKWIIWLTEVTFNKCILLEMSDLVHIIKYNSGYDFKLLATVLTTNNTLILIYYKTNILFWQFMTDVNVI